MLKKVLQFAASLAVGLLIAKNLPKITGWLYKQNSKNETTESGSGPVIVNKETGNTIYEDIAKLDKRIREAQENGEETSSLEMEMKKLIDIVKGKV